MTRQQATAKVVPRTWWLWDPRWDEFVKIEPIVFHLGKEKTIRDLIGRLSLSNGVKTGVIEIIPEQRSSGIPHGKATWQLAN